MENSMGQAPVHFHRLLSVTFTGGLLDKTSLQFTDGLNCLIGGRGTGKTTVLELIRYAFARSSNLDHSRQRAFERLLDHNLKDGVVRVEFETLTGVRYTIERRVNGAPSVYDNAGTPVSLNVAKDTVTGIEIYSQHEIEETADSANLQLRLLDKSIHDIDEINQNINNKTKLLEENAREILNVRKRIADLLELTLDLPDVAEKIRGFQQAADASGSPDLRHEDDALRNREGQCLAEASSVLEGGCKELDNVVVTISDRLEANFNASTDGPNKQLIDDAHSCIRQTMEELKLDIATAKENIDAASIKLAEYKASLNTLHLEQAKQYNEWLSQFEEERAKGQERNALQKRLNLLQKYDNELNQRQRELQRFVEVRDVLRADLSDATDERYRRRAAVAHKLSTRLSPLIRVRIEQFGSRERYRSLLTEAMKGSGLQYRSIVARCVDRLPPSELAGAVQADDCDALKNGLEIDKDRAMRMLLHLKDKPEIFAIETVELDDRPIIELADGGVYKDSQSLSTGQKCTTILPILLIESERPLLIDQPEDNLDNAFIYEKIVKSIHLIRGCRQLIFATHNPNIPVLGDAERVFVLQSTGKAAYVAAVGSVEGVASHVIDLLEGGRAAFDARHARYKGPRCEEG